MKNYSINGKGILSLISITPKEGNQTLIPYDGIAVWEKCWYKPSEIRIHKITREIKIKENNMCRAYILLQGANNGS